MNRRVCVWIGSVLGCAIIGQAAGFGVAARAEAQVAPSVTATLNPLQSSATVSKAQQSSVLAPYISAQIAALQVAATQSAARAALIAGVPRAPLPTLAYRNAYASEFSAQAVKLLAVPTTPMALKINLGVVTAAVATTSQSVDLVPAVQGLLADRQDAVALWGCKAARPLVLVLIQQPASVANGSPLYGDIVKSVKNHGSSGLSGFVAIEAYRALVVNIFNVPGVPNNQVPPLLKPLYNPVLDLLEVRTKMYDQGMVPSPEAEVNAPTFLTLPGVATPPQRDRAIQDLVNLLDAAGQRAATVTNVAQIQALRGTLQNAGGALNVFAGQNLLPQVASMPLGSTGAGIAAATQKVYPTMQIKFAFLKKPPVLPAIAPTTVPAGTPAKP
jgi:hypothetical protein